MATNQATVLRKLYLQILSLNISGLRKKTIFLKHLINQYKPDIICLQETNINDDYFRNKSIYELGADKENSFFNYPNNESNGTAVLYFSPTLKCNNVLYFDEGRTIILDLSQNLCKFTLINVYVPTTSSQRPLFFDSLLTKIENNTSNNNIILAGDFNITLEDKDITGNKGNNRIGRPELQNIIDTFRLKDAFRTLYPSRIETTFQNKSLNRASRIDRIYVSEHFPITNTEHISSTVNFTDHKGVLSHLSNFVNQTPNKPKSVHWKFNDTLLDNVDFVNAVRETIAANTFNCNEHNIFLKN